MVCLEGFPHHHTGSRIQLNQSVWKTLCLVTCGFSAQHSSETGGTFWTLALIAKHVVNIVGADRGGQMVKGFVFLVF